MSEFSDVTAIVLAAGHSRRMGCPKLTLPWGDTTVIGQVVSTLITAGLKDILVVTGGARHEVGQALKGLPVRQVYNPRHMDGDMALSLQAGLRRGLESAQAAMVVLGDQPQMEARVVRAILAAYRETRAALLVPSYQMRRGHPWVVDRRLWRDLLELPPSQTLRDFLNGHAAQIHYLEVNTPTIIQDLDTPEQYSRYRSEESR